MTLTYRGQTYTTSNTTATINTQFTFTYRGQSYQNFASNTVTPKTQLVYRGVPYNTTEAPKSLSLTPAFA